MTGALAELGTDSLALSPRQARETEVDLELSVDQGVGDECLTGWVRSCGRRVALSGVRGVYVRPIEPELVPEAGRADLGDPTSARTHARTLHDTLVAFTEVAPRVTGCRVANRLSAMSSNISKPYQAQAILRNGFVTPTTLITSDPDEALSFAAVHGRVVYKSISGVRSIVTAFDPATDRARLERLRWCPVQFQEQIDGPDVRVHVVDRQLFAAAVESDAVDYRYARHQVGRDPRLTAFELPDDVAERCLSLAHDLELPFAGIDLKLATDGRVVCFEVNPSPGFTWYEQEAGLPIAAAVARWLSRT